jgi:beta-fructofuranosidase
MTRIRPKWHFTPVKGWMNDPHGVFFDGDKYHLFFQYVEDSLKWESTIAWGHATSKDLLHWNQLQDAITPHANEAGCWSGCVAMKDGQPYLYYTSPALDEWNNGSVFVTAPNENLTTWYRLEENPVITIPRQLGVKDFRDPQIRKHGSSWRLMMAAGLQNGQGAIVEYESADLLEWNLLGILATCETDLKEPSPKSTVWECPQFFEIEGQWVLLISAMDATGHIGVRYALGTYDGKTFSPTFWGDFCKSGLLYATSIFYDKTNRLSAISWFKEVGDVPPTGSTWNGAQSLPVYLTLENNQLMVAPVSTLEFQKLETQDSEHVDSNWAVEITSANWSLEVTAEESWSITAHNGVLKVDTFEAKEFSVGTSSNFKIMVDADLLEIFTDASDGHIAMHVPANKEALLKLSVEES